MARTPVRVYVALGLGGFRRDIAAPLSSAESFQLVGKAEDGPTALQEISRIQPDVAVVEVNLLLLNGLVLCREVSPPIRESEGPVVGGTA